MAKAFQPARKDKSREIDVLARETSFESVIVTVKP